jgi:hypothetical protein
MMNSSNDEIDFLRAVSTRSGKSEGKMLASEAHLEGGIERHWTIQWKSKGGNQGVFNHEQWSHVLL